LLCREGQLARFSHVLRYFSMGKRWPAGRGTT
jgi:hypothetical protein